MKADTRFNNIRHRRFPMPKIWRWNMTRKVLAMLVMVLSIVWAGSAFAAEVFYVSSAKAKVMASPNFKSQILGEVSRGFKFENGAKQGTWVKVKYNNKDAFVSSLLLSKQPPMDKGAIKSGAPEIKEGARKRASTFASAAAARGLASDDRKRVSKEEKVDYDSLEKIESINVSDAELKKFAEEK